MLDSQNQGDLRAEGEGGDQVMLSRCVKKNADLDMRLRAETSRPPSGSNGPELASGTPASLDAPSTNHLQCPHTRTNTGLRI